MGTFWATIGRTPNPGTSDYLATLALLFVFGLGFNYGVGEIERRRIEGYTWHEVVIGTGVAVLTSALLIGLVNALIVLVCLGASGLPMIIGAHNRHEHAKRDELARLKELVGDKANDGNQATTPK